MAFGSGLVMAMAMPPMAQCQHGACGLCERRASRLMQRGRWLAVASARWRPWHAPSVAAGEWVAQRRLALGDLGLAGCAACSGA